MVDAGAAIKLDATAWFNKDGNKAPTEENCAGQQSSYKLTCPDLVLFMDEVGDNTSQKNNRNVGGQKLLMDPKHQALMQSVFPDCHFTVLRFTATSGKPICCAIILACKEMYATYMMSIHP